MQIAIRFNKAPICPLFSASDFDENYFSGVVSYFYIHGMGSHPGTFVLAYSFIQNTKQYSLL